MPSRATSDWRSILYLYGISLVVGALCLWAIITYGQQHQSPNTSVAVSTAVVGHTAPVLLAVVDAFRKNLNSPFGGLILQILTILAASRACGVVFRRFGQP